MRIGAHKMSWCLEPDMRLWNLFDLLLVLMSLIDFVIFRASALSSIRRHRGVWSRSSDGFTEVKLLKTLRIMSASA